MVEKFGGLNAKEHELRSTIIYVAKEEPLEEKDLLNHVKEIKPYFSVAEIDNAYKELKPLLYV